MIEARRFLGRLPPRAWGGILLAAIVLGGGVQLADIEPGLPSDGLYLVRVDPGSPFEPALDDPRLRVGEPADVRFADVLYVKDTDRGAAVQTIVHDRVRAHNERLLENEVDTAAAFPVRIDAFYLSRDVLAAQAAQEPTEPGGDAGGGASDPSDGSSGSSGGSEGPTPTEREPAAEAATAQPDIRPRDLEPPFPARSLLLTFAYVIPAGFLLQLHGANVHSERTQGRARILLSTPLSPARLLWQKAAPFALMLLLVNVVVTLLLGAGWYGFAAAGVVLVLMLSMTTFMALWARNPRELGMLQVGSTTMLNVFLFLPAMFPSLPPVAYLSPMHVVAQGMAGASIPFAAFAYAVMPTLLAATALGALAVAFACEELWLGSGPRIRRAVERASPGWRALPAGILVVPFVFVLQLTIIVSLAVLGLNVALWFALPASVLTEELAKSLAARGRSWRTGALVGAGFFIGEKTALLLTLVGFRDLPYGQEALALLGSGGGWLMLAAPLLLHVATGLLVTRRRWGLPAAAVLHFVYDQIIIQVGT